jgi:hypothetical protein
MEIYTYIEENLIKLDKEVTFVVDVDELLKLKEFIDFCVEGMKTNDKFSHEHFSDFLYYKKQCKIEDNIDIIISKNYEKK